MLSATKDATTVLSAPIQMGLDDSLEYLAEDELIEVGCTRDLCSLGLVDYASLASPCILRLWCVLTQVTPESVRIRKNPTFGKKR